MKVSDFIEWLKTQDQDAVVRVMVQGQAPEYAPWGECTPTPFNHEFHADYIDFRDNPWLKGQPNEKARFLDLGVRD